MLSPSEHMSMFMSDNECECELNVSSTGSRRIKMREYEHHECEYE